MTRSPRAEIRQAELVAGYQAAMAGEATETTRQNEGRNWDVEDAVRNALEIGEKSLQTA